MARILIVEDDPINAEIAGVICVAAGHHVLFAINGAEALQRLNEGPIDLVLADVIMPVMDGIAMTDAIRHAALPLASVPIIGVTAQASQLELDTMMKVGMTQVVTKPFRGSTLREVIASVLERNGSASAKPLLAG